MVPAISRKHVMLAPSGVLTNAESRFLRLPHPRTLSPALFLPAPIASTSAEAATRDELLELQAVKPDADKARSYFIEQEVLSDGSLSLLTPFDPLYLIVALLSPLPPHYLALDQLWESASQLSFASPLEEKKGGGDEEMEGNSSFADDVLRFGGLGCVKNRMAAVCETKEHDGSILYRLSQSLVISALKSKIERLTDPTLGIFGPLESVSLGRSSETPKVEGETPPVEGATSEVAEGEKVYPTVSRGLGREGVGDGQGMSAEIQIETRCKSALGIIANYLPPATSHTLLAAYSFPALTAHLSTISTSSVLSSTYLPGRGGSSSSLGEDGSSSNGGGSAAAALKAKKAAAKGSRGVETLKKVNTQGMSKLSSFFAKVPPKPKEKVAAGGGNKRKAAGA